VHPACVLELTTEDCTEVSLFATAAVCALLCLLVFVAVGSHRFSDPSSLST